VTAPTFASADALRARSMGVSLDCPANCPNCAVLSVAEANRREERDQQVTLVSMLENTLRVERRALAWTRDSRGRWQFTALMSLALWVCLVASIAWGWGIR
jgi:hypothetical protein